MRLLNDWLAFPLALTLTLGGCATAPATIVNGSEVAPVRSSRNVIARTDIDASSLSNPLELIHALRPTWLTHRGQEGIVSGQTVDVYVDGQKQDVRYLSQVPLQQVERLEFLSPSEATHRFGTQQGGGSGAIMVTMRRR